MEKTLISAKTVQAQNTSEAEDTAARAATVFA
ncbi:hypothetical protein BINDI_1315 [Bifidobacterium [indicum] DSM 20214 = LMG 11587]|uniref:Uncharacterized protein n=1 Tax=Bifidobacterium [indicum] DSM 20214 = LMG 11587 TaxID=1341694 RepID=A0A087VW39_9BIFI|nr:hypothetical protein BINDI_1315 [Bifidobacterium indicum LMG 11587 = DSM 20214]